LTEQFDLKWINWRRHTWLCVTDDNWWNSSVELRKESRLMQFILLRQ